MAHSIGYAGGSSGHLEGPELRSQETLSRRTFGRAPASRARLWGHTCGILRPLEYRHQFFDFIIALLALGYLFGDRGMDRIQG